MKINVLVNIYRNYFPEKYSGNYIYDNVRAINKAEQPIVDKCITEMEKQKALVILDREMILPINELRPIEIDRKAILNTADKKFEF